jgi:hypothetical protein
MNNKKRTKRCFFCNRPRATLMYLFDAFVHRACLKRMLSAQK